MQDFLLALGVVLLWIALNRWILPRFGIRTCMSGGCSLDCASTPTGQTQKQADKDVVDLTLFTDEEHPSHGYSKAQEVKAD